MAMTASSMAYSWSKWNSEVGDKEKIVIQGCEQLKDEALFEVRQHLVLTN
jgi:cancer susceptibility candidate protein 1